MLFRRSSICLLLVLTVACSSDLSDDPIPVASFADIVIDINFPAYVILRNTGGFTYVNGGVRGIIVYRSTGNSFLAYERNCSFHPNEACATVNVHSSSLYMTDPCCSSDFSFQDGSPTGGQAWQPLRRYRTQFNGSTLTLSDEALN